MAFFTLIPFVAALCSFVLALGAVVRRLQSVPAWSFAAGMAALGLDSLFTGLSLRSAEVGEGVGWLSRSIAVTGVAPLPWLCFSLTYARGASRAFLARQWASLLLLGVLPAVLALAAPEPHVQFIPASATAAAALRFSVAGWLLNVVLLVAFVLVLVNLEQTLRAAVGTMRWRIKFVVLGAMVMIGTQLYTRSQALLFSMPSLGLAGVESSALLIGCLFLVLAYARTGLGDVDVHPSTAVLRSSFTILIVGGYLFVVGFLAQLVERFGGAGSFQFQAFVVLLGMAGLAVLLLSNRLRQHVRSLVARHFRRARHDSTRIWTQVSDSLAQVNDRAGLSTAVVRVLSETFEVLSVAVWLPDERDGQLQIGASSAQSPLPDEGRVRASKAVASALGETGSEPFDLDIVDEPWADELRRLNPDRFASGGHRWVVPLPGGESGPGAIVLGDRVNRAAYTPEERELLRCIGAQIASTLMSLRLANEVALARELDAFQTMSAFFVHDLKNTAAALNVTLRNMPAHFDDPAFREDALRVVENASRRIDEMIARLGALRERPHIRPVPTDLGRVVREACERAGAMPGIDLESELLSVPAVMADPEQIRSVIVNLLANARDALDGTGRIEVRTAQDGPFAVVSVTDNGPGIPTEFIRDSLFRPFRSTKKKGLGIGLYQSHTIVRLHRGSIQVESAPGGGTTFRVSLPTAREPDSPGARPAP